ncbi:hypothetical protein OHC33_001117 [Knufia fluminis]|uniref:Uncharacterized protein n=1 Tax=Knufia fluminis TaxID=191047 RepID=A0AAN8ESR5_9EURO|nr:hypothetical protein OHC33_001117 [Knufia fluminis]
MPPKRTTSDSQLGASATRRRTGAKASTQDPSRVTEGHPGTNNAVSDPLIEAADDGAQHNATDTQAPTANAGHTTAAASQVDAGTDRLNAQSTAADRLVAAATQLQNASATLVAAANQLGTPLDQSHALGSNAQPAPTAQNVPALVLASTAPNPIPPPPPAPTAQNGPALVSAPAPAPAPLNPVPPPQAWQIGPGGPLALLLNYTSGPMHTIFAGEFIREDWYMLKAWNRVCGNPPWPDWNPFRDPLSLSHPGPGRYLRVRCGNIRIPLPIHSDIPQDEQDPPVNLQQEWGLSEGPSTLCPHNQLDSQGPSGNMEFYRCEDPRHWHNGDTRISHRRPKDWLCAPCTQQNRKYLEATFQRWADHRIWTFCKECSDDQHDVMLQEALQQWNAMHLAPAEQKHAEMTEDELEPVRKLYWCICRYSLPIGTAHLCWHCFLRVHDGWERYLKREMDAIIPRRRPNGDIHDLRTWVQ